MKERIAEKRGRFLVQELDEDQINFRSRHYSLINFKGAQHLFSNDICENLENTNLQILHTSFVYDFKIRIFIDFGSIWQIFSKKLRRETDYMNIIFNYSTVDNFHSHSHSDDTLSEFDAIISSQKIISSNTEDYHEPNEYRELGHSNVFDMNPNNSDNLKEKEH